MATQNRLDPPQPRPYEAASHDEPAPVIAAPEIHTLPAEVWCVECGARTAPGVCGACGQAAALDGTYLYLECIGEGTSGQTWRALDLKTGGQVAVKERMLRKGSAPKMGELLRREVEVLRQLDHPAIPGLLADGIVHRGRFEVHYLVQEFVPGQTLAQAMTTHRFSEGEVRATLEALLEILVWLHGLSPPVIHRDLKPSNLIRRTTDGRLVLIDFGSVRDAVRGEMGGSTVAGTFGYMPPEQLVGDATPASDLYAAGVLCIELLTRRVPSALLDTQQHLRWRPHAEVSAPFADLLDTLVRPDVATRPRHAADVLRRLRALPAPGVSPLDHLIARVRRGVAWVTNSPTRLTAVGLSVLLLGIGSYLAPWLNLAHTLRLGEPARISAALEAERVAVGAHDASNLSAEDARAALHRETAELLVTFSPGGQPSEIGWTRVDPRARSVIANAMAEGTLEQLHLPRAPGVQERVVTLRANGEAVLTPRPGVAAAFEGVSAASVPGVPSQTITATLGLHTDGTVLWVAWAEGTSEVLRYVLEPFVFAASFPRAPEDGPGAVTRRFRYDSQRGEIRLVPGLGRD